MEHVELGLPTWSLQKSKKKVKEVQSTSLGQVCTQVVCIEVCDKAVLCSGLSMSAVYYTQRP